jgi:hypothetical protein
MEGLGLTELSEAKRRLDLGDKAACVALCHGDRGLRGQSYLREQVNDLGGCRMPYTQSLKKQTPWRQGGSRIDAR